jgi:hypothetical protein
MTPSNKLEQDIEDSSSSGASFLQSMNQLSTAKDSDSREMSDIFVQERKSVETSEDSESDHSESAKSPPFDRKAKDGPISLSKEAEASPIDNSTKMALASQQESGSSDGKELAGDTSLGLLPNVSNRVVASLPSTIIEPMLAVEAKGPLSLDVNTKSSNSDRPAPSALPSAKDTTSASQHSCTSSDHSVAHTIESPSSANSSRSENASLLPMTVPVPKSGAITVDRASGVDAKAPVGHVHSKGVSFET